MDYKEITKKNGTKIVFCNFEELLCEAYGVKTMSEVEPHVSSTGEYIIRCPLCASEHTKHKLYIKDDLTVGHCFLCDRAYVNITDEVNVNFNVPKFNMFWGKSEFMLPELKSPDWQLDTFKYELDDFDQRGYDYLVGRHKYLGELYKILGFKFYDGNVVMPFYWKGQLVYYQIRFIDSNSSIRYFFPPVNNKIPYTIDRKLDVTRIIICEGVYDAIACMIMAPNFIPVAILGKNITDYQLDFLKEYTPIKEISIYMDKTELSIGVSKKIKQAGIFCPIRIIKSDGQDPEENLKDRIKWNRNLQYIMPSVPS